MSYKNNYNGRHDNDEQITAWMCPKEDKNGNTFWQGSADLGKGKAVKLTMFESKGEKSDFVVNVTKKTYKPRQQRKNSW